MLRMATCSHNSCYDAIGWVGWVQVAMSTPRCTHAWIYPKPLNLHTELVPYFQLAQSCRNQEFKKITVLLTDLAILHEALGTQQCLKQGQHSQLAWGPCKDISDVYSIHQYTDYATNHSDFILFAVRQVSSGQKVFFGNVIA